MADTAHNPVREDDRDVITPLRHRATIAGVAVEASAVTIGRIPAFLDAAEAALPHDTLDELDLQTACAHNAEAVCRLIAIGLQQPEEWVQGLGYDDLAQAMQLVVAANRRFFIHLVSRRARQAARQQTEAAITETEDNIPSPISSPDWSPGGTA